MKSKLLRNTLAAAFAGLFAASASAATFTFNQSSGFDVTSLTSNDPTTNGNDIVWNNYAGGDPNFPITGNASPAGTFNTVAWGVPSINNGGAVGFDPFLINSGFNSDYSGLRVIGLSGALTTGVNNSFGGWESISTTYHRNQAIGGSAWTLSAGLIYSEFQLVEPGLVDNHPLPFTFLETFNTALNDDAANCTNGAPQGTVCDDLFKFPSIGFAPLVFSHDGKWYEIEFGIGNFVNSSTNFPGCDSGPLCTVWTAEEAISSLDVLARIREIPEPSTIALLGAALLGLGFRRRKS